MAIDPVCKMEVEETEAEFTSEREGKTEYFCSEDCKRQFDKNPEEFTAAA